MVSSFHWLCQSIAQRDGYGKPSNGNRDRPAHNNAARAPRGARRARAALQLAGADEAASAAPGAPGAVDGRHGALAVLINDGVEEPVTGEMMVMHELVGTQHPPWARITCPAPNLPVMMTVGGRTPPGILELHFAE